MKADDFLTSIELKNIFLEEAIYDLNEILYDLELYKFQTRTSIIQKLNDSKEFADPILDLKELNRDASFNEVECKYNILVDRVLSRQVTVIYPVTGSINRDAIELQLSSYSINYMAVTPFNFAVLAGETSFAYTPKILFKRILMEAIALHATDIHFCVEHKDLQPTYPVKYRKNGNFYEMHLFTLTENLNKSIISQLIETQTNANALDLITPAGVSAMSDDPLGNGTIELRIAANPVKDGWHCVIRIQSKETFGFNIESLGFSTDVQQALHKLTTKRSGIIFITGAIRTGKNTTAFAVLNEMVNEPIKIISYESPIEVLMPFTQVEYNGDTETLLHAVRLAKKQDVNIAYINELPNKEVAFAVRDLVNSSVCVLTTMHMDRLWHLPYKLKEYYGEEYKDIISQINGVFNQKMYGKPCPHCADMILPETLSGELSSFLLKRGVKKVAVHRGCDACAHTGLIQGENQPYVEYLMFSPELKSQLLECDAPYKMEKILRDTINKEHHSLEDTMCDAIIKDKLSINALYDII